jgi:hypothetical protein
MGQVVQINGDYSIKTRAGSDIILDTGTNGNVKVTGNLVVEGDTLTVSANNLNVNDNIITLNFQETGPGVTLRYSGIQVDRGTLSGSLDADPESPPPASFLFDENTDAWQLAYGSPDEGFSFVESNLRVQAILTNSDAILSRTGRTGDLLLIGTGNGIITVKGTNDYESRVLDDDDIPNKKYVDTAIQLTPTFQIVRDNTRVVAFDDQNPNTLFPIGPFFEQPEDNQVAVVVDNIITASFYSDEVKIRGLSIFEDGVDTITIEAFDTKSIKLETVGSGTVQFTNAAQFENHGNALASPLTGTIMYGGNISAGATGLYIVNNDYRDELVTKNKALLFSMIF